MSIDVAGEDPLWPRASDWLANGPGGRQVDLAVLGVPAHRTSLSPTNAQATPPAIRAALARYSTWSSSRQADLELLAVQDLGDMPEPDSYEEDTELEVADVDPSARLLIGLGGDNSITYALARGLFGAEIHKAGLVTVDGQYGLRDGTNNQSAVRRLIEAGMAPNHVVQLGINDWTNSRLYAERARTWGVRVTGREEIAARGMTPCMRDALDIASRGGGGVFVDLDLSVCDRSIAPACPASVPGGISANDLREAAFLAGQHQTVEGIDITEVDATADGDDGRTVRLAAICLLEASAGLVRRHGLRS